jgi:hypothetical protein
MPTGSIALSEARQSPFKNKNIPIDIITTTGGHDAVLKSLALELMKLAISDSTKT